jgi:tetratricopeptide (TPR) repeat protein
MKSMGSLEMIDFSQKLRELIDQDRHADALTLLHEAVAAHPSTDLFYTRAKVHFGTGDLEAARQDYLRARTAQFPLHFRPLLLEVGMLLWLQGEREAACEDWAGEIRRIRSREITHTSAGYCGLDAPARLWWASAHAELAHWRPVAVKDLRGQMRCKYPEKERWPGTLVPFLLGRVEEKAVLSKAGRGPRAAEQLCEAHFHLAGKALAEGDEQQYREELALAIQHGEQTPFRESDRPQEYFLARYELSPGAHPRALLTPVADQPVPPASTSNQTRR